MAVLTWDNVGNRFYETGIDKGVLYIPDSNGAYVNGVAWNGLTSVSEAPSGAEPNAQYADNIKYLNLFSAEEFGATVEAFTYPDEFAQFDGLGVPTPGVSIGQQSRRMFGLSYRTKIGNDIDGDDYAYKVHLVYGCQASPSEKAYATVNDSPEAITFSWEITTTPVNVTSLKPTSVLTIDSSKVNPATLASLEQILYGTSGVDPALPLPDTIITMFGSGVITVTPSIPAYNSSTDTITIPTVTGVGYYIDDTLVPAGAVVITEDTMVQARPNAGYVFTSGVDDDWFYDYTPVKPKLIGDQRMLTITIEADELFDEEKQEFIEVEGVTLQLEHSLVSLSKWESKYQVAFLSGKEKTPEQMLDYIRFMIVSPDVDETALHHCSEKVLNEINDYINSNQSATTFGDMPNRKAPNEIITSELIYYWMVAFTIPFDCQDWHLNRLFSLIRICNVKNGKQKKMPKHEIAQRNRDLNAQRKAALGTTG